MVTLFLRRRSDGQMAWCFFSNLSRVLAVSGVCGGCLDSAALPQCVWVISDNIINYRKKSADQSPVTGCAQWKHNSYDTESLCWDQETQVSYMRHGRVLGWRVLWGPSYQISSSQLTRLQTAKKSIFSKLEPSGACRRGHEVMKCASDNKVPSTNQVECEHYW